MKVVDSYFTKIEDNNIFLYRGLLQYYTWNKSTQKSPSSIRPHYCDKKRKIYKIPV